MQVRAKKIMLGLAVEYGLVFRTLTQTRLGGNMAVKVWTS